jgi:hypothetical protein
VEEDEAAVDERPEPGRPAHPDLVGGDFFAGGEADPRGVARGGDREHLMAAGEVDDAAVIGGRLLRHRFSVLETKGTGNRAAASREKRSNPDNDSSTALRRARP